MCAQARWCAAAITLAQSPSRPKLIERVFRSSLSQSNRISDLSKTNQRTVRRLWKQKPVSVDKITGLFKTIENTFYKENPNFEPSGWNKPTTELNYAPLPGRLKPLSNRKELLHVTTDTLEIHVDKGTRLNGTRVGIHVHENAGITFVMRGKKGGITDFVEGYTNTFNPTVHYYYMPANTIMSASNFSGSDVKLMDLFITPPGEPPITILEPGYPGYMPG